jgi:branched-chain amino acid transport system ATP-binding protein
MSLLVIERLNKRFSGLTATENLDLTVEEGELHGIIGPNGAGKTTLINQLSGDIIPDSGRILFNGIDVTRASPSRRAQLGIGRSYQITAVFPEFTVLENVMLACAATNSRQSIWRPLMTDKFASEQSQALLSRVGLSEEHDRPASQLAHGAKRQLELAMSIATRPKLLLLDEPMAGMSARETGAVADLLRALKRQYTIVLVEHDIDVVFALADRVTVLVYGHPIACGTVDQIQSDPDVKAAYLGNDEESL